jgi:lambda family phage portal protein
VGPTGFSFQSKAADGAIPDKGARIMIEQAFADWKMARNCTVTGDMPYHELKNLSERAIARDGNILIRIMRGYPESYYKFALQILEADHLDYNYNRTFADGSKIVMGKEINAYGRPVAYHISGQHPGDVYSWSGKQYTRIPAKDVIHRYYRERPGQAMGVPLVTTAITGLRHIERYEEAEQIAARISACSAVAIEKDYQPGWDGGDAAQSEFDQDLEPGAVWNLPYGQKATLINPTHPNANYEGFRKGVLRGVASGLLMNYNTIGSDLEGVNYSSLREGKLNQKDIFLGFRSLNIENEERPIFEAWLETVLTLGILPLPLAKIWKFRKAEWRGRVTEWVDPLKDSKGKLSDLEMGNTSLRAVIAEKGGDIETVLRERAEDFALFESLGLTPPAWYTAGVPAQQPMEEPDEDEKPDEMEDDEEDDA